MEKNFSNWIQTNFEKIKLKNLQELHLPGTHDSAAYDLQHVPYFIRKWAITQNKSILEQLRAGIRALDIRVTETDSPFGYYASHTFICCSLDIILADIKTFIKESEKEIIVLYCSFDNCFSSQTALKNYIYSYFTEGDECSVGSFNLYNNVQVKDLDKRILYSFDGPRTWINKPTASEWMIAYKETNFVCNVLDLALTPTAFYIFTNPYESLASMAKELAYRVDGVIDLSNWFIVFTDFPSDEFIEEIINYNLLADPNCTSIHSS